MDGRKLRLMIAGGGIIEQLFVETKRWVSNKTFLPQVMTMYEKYLITALK